MNNKDIYLEFKAKIESEINKLIEELKNNSISQEFYDGSVYMHIKTEKILLEIIKNT